MEASVAGYVDVDKLQNKISSSLSGTGGFSASSTVDYDGFKQFASSNKELTNLLRWCPACCDIIPKNIDVICNGVEGNAGNSLKYRGNHVTNE